jgi:hypothetical protein
MFLEPTEWCHYDPRTVSSVVLDIFSFEMKKGDVESPNAESAIKRVNCTSSHTSGTVTDPGFVSTATITSGGGVFLGHATLVSSAFHQNGDGIDLM